MPRSPTFSALSKGICAFTKKVGDLNLCYVIKEKGKVEAQIPDFFFAIKGDLCIHKKSRGSKSLLRYQGKR